jgi:polyisoprenoid-binding protein YceI
MTTTATAPTAATTSSAATASASSASAPSATTTPASSPTASTAPTAATTSSAPIASASSASAPSATTASASSPTASTPTASTATVSTPASQSTWAIDRSHSLVEFSVRHMMISTVKGRFTAISGTIVDVADDPSLSSVQVEIDPASITTGDDKRDAHLRSPDFFDVEHFPTITFKSTRVEGTRDSFKLTGLLTIRDQTREVTLDAAFNGFGRNQMGELASFSASTKLSRKDFGLAWNVALETGGVMVSDQFKVEIEIEAIKQEPAS